MRKGMRARRFFVFVLAVFLVYGIGLKPNLIYAEDEATPVDAEDTANEIHKVASSDMIYAQEESKALYYQNLKIIELLKEIRDLLKEHSLKADMTQR